MKTAQDFYELTDAVGAKFGSSQAPSARNDAIRLKRLASRFRGNWNYPNAVHVANLALGRACLSRGDVKGAERYLLRSTEAEGSRQMQAFGPNTLLALELLEAGRVKVVLEFLSRCTRFWRIGGSTLATWIAQIERGKIPNFGPNLVYLTDPATNNRAKPARLDAKTKRMLAKLEQMTPGDQIWFLQSQSPRRPRDRTRKKP